MLTIVEEEYILFSPMSSPETMSWESFQIKYESDGVQKIVSELIVHTRQ